MGNFVKMRHTADLVNGLKRLIDFEVAEDIDNTKIPFEMSHDIIGKENGRTHRCLFSDDPFSIIKGFSE